MYLAPPGVQSMVFSFGIIFNAPKTWTMSKKNQKLLNNKDSMLKLTELLKLLVIAIFYMWKLFYQPQSHVFLSLFLVRRNCNAIMKYLWQFINENLKYNKSCITKTKIKCSTCVVNIKIEAKVGSDVLKSVMNESTEFFGMRPICLLEWQDSQLRKLSYFQIFLAGFHAIKVLILSSLVCLVWDVEKLFLLPLKCRSSVHKNYQYN